MDDVPPIDPIATRTLDVDGVPGFHLRIGRPFLESDGDTWRCAYEVDGPLTQRRGSFCGVDAVQALLLVLAILGVEGEISEENRQGRLSWCEEGAPFGFPAPEADPTLPKRSRE